MMDFNSSASLSGRLQELFDHALEAERDATPAREYLGASRLGASCERQLQYEYVKAPVDHGKGFSGRIATPSRGAPGALKRYFRGGRCGA